jgi:hypothetical protein
MNNAKFDSALPILTLLDLSKGERLSSEWIAGRQINQHLDNLYTGRAFINQQIREKDVAGI